MLPFPLVKPSCIGCSDRSSVVLFCWSNLLRTHAPHRKLPSTNCISRRRLPMGTESLLSHSARIGGFGRIACIACLLPSHSSSLRLVLFPFQVPRSTIYPTPLGYRAPLAVSHAPILPGVASMIAPVAITHSTYRPAALCQAWLSTASLAWLPTMCVPHLSTQTSYL